MWCKEKSTHIPAVAWQAYHCPQECRLLLLEAGHVGVLPAVLCLAIWGDESMLGKGSPSLTASGCARCVVCGAGVI